MADNIKKKLGEVIDAHKSELCQMSDKIFDLAEISGEEYKTSEMLCKYLEKGETELRIPIAEPGTNQPMSVAPGGKGTFTVYIHASSVTTVSLQLYVIE